MRIKTLSFLMAGLVAGLAPAAQSAAQAQSRSQENLARLEQAAQRNEDEQRTTRGAHPNLKRQMSEIDKAIQRLKAGQKVTTEEIDQILGETSFERAQ
jgi:septal ring factor EnvC (AmiA/AmiB activator)